MGRTVVLSVIITRSVLRGFFKELATEGGERFSWGLFCTIDVIDYPHSLNLQ